ncbi:unnamed protein product [Penicillium olsonii]|uniref:Geranylgeranyl pyrophosphate synthetase n=1 Tax=Penicillium olsonii TaxID=99116 RepID=A0A9W4MMP8_PENOL|nr:unnamed protein product [Penicillium olsonii]CAG7975161.1 unnamed protein product [Penicillium olsonii]
MVSWGRKSSGYWGIGKGRYNPGIERPKISPVPAPPLGNILATIQHDDLDDSRDEDLSSTRITEAKYLASYNWLNEGHRIIVPGEPPKWTPLSEPTELRQDSDEYYQDLNTARHPSYPLEPMVQAIILEKPDFSLRDVDIIACGATMNNLLRFARHQDAPFRMLVEVVGDTVFFVRRLNSPTEKIPEVWGYGHTFPDAYTTWSQESQGSQSHQRIMSYKLAGMSCLVRYEADGFLPDLVPKDLVSQEDDAHEDSNSVEDLQSAMQGATISSMAPTTTGAESSNIEILKKGHHIPQCGIFDLKTRSIKKRDVDILEAEIPRLWIRQVPNFIVAYHLRGTFNDIQVQDVTKDLKNWEDSQQPALMRFANLLHMIVAFARSAVEGRIEIEHEEGGDVLNLREQVGIVNKVLPPALLGKWED